MARAVVEHSFVLEVRLLRLGSVGQLDRQPTSWAGPQQPSQADLVGWIIRRC
jgi:hypothetical protein